MESATQVGKLSYAACLVLGAEEAKRQVVLDDGADGIKTQAGLHFPQAVKIRDWLHLRQVIHQTMRYRHPSKGEVQYTWRK